MIKTKIDWCDTTWNPVTGCFHECDYCYARRIAERFEGCDNLSNYGVMSESRFRRINPQSDIKYAVYETSEDTPPIIEHYNPKTEKTDVAIAPYPFGFQPTLHKHLLNLPYKWKKPRKIFVCSMADLFGDWVPDEWIEQVLEICKKNSQHQYFFLTKNPKRYLGLAEKGKLSNKTECPQLWFGTTITTMEEPYFFSENHNTFISLEPIKQDFMPVRNLNDDWMIAKWILADWVIIGAETGSSKNWRTC